ncbi:hypothetical protein PBY51_011793 [Eleginops maclovinus]|uniref:Uncharacterized protein n=1 Tax=Eleginops maclovinus TaxID=56733 RepID=A0AAN7XW30_ELEMC|nr:hypothetical protein PBY51_011793 [Eleginops maclovinus]
MILSLSSSSHLLTTSPRVATAPLLHPLLPLPCPLTPLSLFIIPSSAGRGLLRALFPPCSSALPALGIRSCRTRPLWSTSPPGLGHCSASRVYSSLSSTRRVLSSATPPQHPRVWDSYTQHLDSLGEAGVLGEEMEVAAVVRVGVQVQEAAPEVHGAAQQEQGPLAVGEVEQEGAHMQILAAGITRWTR